MKNLKTEKDAIVYLTECTLATVASMANKKKKVKHEFERQISIAQAGVDFINNSYLDQSTNVITVRVFTVINNYKGSVINWANKNNG